MIKGTLYSGKGDEASYFPRANHFNSEPPPDCWGWGDNVCTSVQQWKGSWPVLPLGASASLWGLEPGHKRIVCHDEKPDRHILHVHHMRQGLSLGAPFSDHVCPQTCHRIYGSHHNPGVEMVWVLLLCQQMRKLRCREALTSPSHTIRNCQQFMSPGHLSPKSLALWGPILEESLGMAQWPSVSRGQLCRPLLGLTSILC